jgi:hypothetical protein
LFSQRLIYLLGTTLFSEFTLRKVKQAKYRITICLAFLVLLLLIWAELAVGIFWTLLSGHRLRKKKITNFEINVSLLPLAERIPYSMKKNGIRQDAISELIK